MSFEYNDQMRIIHDPNNPDLTQVPKMPLLIIQDGIVFEANSVRGAMAALVGPEYLDCESSETEWLVRVELARKESMKALARDIDTIVYDFREGIIKNNFAAKEGDPDYEGTSEEDIQIRVEDDRLLLLSLVKIGAITILEREDSFLFRKHPKWELIETSSGVLKNCGRCVNMDHDPVSDGDEGYCPVYNKSVRRTDGKTCSSYGVDTGTRKGDKLGGIYIDISEESSIDELIHLHETIIKYNLTDVK